MINVSDMISEVRGNLDELNDADVTDEFVLLKLNAAQRSMARLISRRYDTLLMDYVDITISGGVQEYAIPDNCFGNRIEHLEVWINQVPNELKEISIKQASLYDNQTSGSLRPYYYALYGKTIRLFPKPSSGSTVRVWYNKKLDKLVKPQGRITNVNTSENYVIVSDLGDDITTEATSLNSYINVVDGMTGTIRGTLQVAYIDSSIGQVKFKTTGLTKSSVLNRTISTSLPSDLETTDYLSTVHGTCIGQVPENLYDYIIQHAIMGCKRKNGDGDQLDFAEMNELRNDLKAIAAGRPIQRRVSKRNRHLTSKLFYSNRRFT